MVIIYVPRQTTCDVYVCVSDTKTIFLCIRTADRFFLFLCSCFLRAFILTNKIARFCSNLLEFGKNNYVTIPVCPLRFFARKSVYSTEVSAICRLPSSYFLRSPFTASTKKLKNFRR